MTKLLFYFIVLLLIAGAFYYAVSDNKEAALEQGTIDQMTDEAAQKLTDHIRIPIGKASDLKNQEDERVRKMEEDMKKQMD